MSRTCVVTGSASGIGKATRDLLEERGTRVIGVDIRDAEVIADLGKSGGRRRMVSDVRALIGDSLDAVISCAGLGYLTSGAESIVRVNYFGAIATLIGLRPMLARSESAAAAVVAYLMIVNDLVDQTLVEACLEGNETVALQSPSVDDGAAAYASTKRAVAVWVRRSAPTSQWAGAGIALNAVAPGAIETPMTEPTIGTRSAPTEAFQNVALRQPFGGIGSPIDVASLLVWLKSAENLFVTGQVVFVDCGHECVIRGEDVFGNPAT